ncbi:MAG: hypothetical protein ACOZAO_04320 [Patescibacteria group bacterium]
MFMQLGGNDDEGGFFEELMRMVTLRRLMSLVSQTDPSSIEPERIARHLAVEKELFGDETFGDWVAHATVRGCPGCAPMYKALLLHIPAEKLPKNNMPYSQAADQLIAQLNKL